MYPDQERWYSELSHNGTDVRTTVYAGEYEKITENGKPREFYAPNGNTIAIREISSSYQALHGIAILHTIPKKSRLASAGRALIINKVMFWGYRKNVSGSVVINNTLGYERNVFSTNNNIPNNLSYPPAPFIFIPVKGFHWK